MSNAFPTFTYTPFFFLTALRCLLRKSNMATSRCVKLNLVARVIIDIIASCFHICSQGFSCMDEFLAPAKKASASDKGKSPVPKW